MPGNKPFKIRLMTNHDLDQAMSLSMAEGWNQTENDWKLLLDNSLNICIVAECKNQIIGTATSLNFLNKVAWIGMVLVDKDLRGQGIGKMLLTGIIKKLKVIESIKLDATPAGQPLYQKLGFKEEHVILRMTKTSSNISLINESKGKTKLIGRQSLPEVLKLDNKISGYDRTYLLQTVFQNYPEKAFLIKRSNNLDGYIFGRDGNLSNYIGPAYARSINSAKVLISKALSSIDNKPVAIDVLQDKKDLIEWLESIGFVKQRQFMRMYQKSNPYTGIVKNQYLISGPEFG